MLEQAKYFFLAFKKLKEIYDSQRQETAYFNVHVISLPS